MKHLIVIFLLLLSSVLYAQTKTPVPPATSNPSIPVAPGVHTTVTNQPSSMPNSNTNPTTGIVISPKAKNASRTINPPGTGMPDTTLKSSRTRPVPHKKAAKKKRLV